MTNSTPTKPFDPSLPCETRSGLKVRIICTDRAGPRSLIALTTFVDGRESVSSYYENGTMDDEVEGPLDLVNTVVKASWYAYVYTDGRISEVYKSIRYCMTDHTYSITIGYFEYSVEEGEIMEVTFHKKPNLP